MTHRPLIERAAARQLLDPRLVEAIVLKESSGNSWAWNPEPKYRYLWNVRTHRAFRPLTYAERASEEPPLDFPALAGDRDQEWWGQQASWGLMQPMGAVARECGLMAPYLTELCDPELNLTIGCQYLKKLLSWAGNASHRALAAYNAGPGGADSPVGKSYAQDVLARYTVLLNA